MNPLLHFWSQSLELSNKIAQVFQQRAATAVARIGDRWRKSLDSVAANPESMSSSPWKAGAAGWEYSIDAVQRMFLFWDILRQRGDNWLDHEKAGKPPVLHFEYETILDARQFQRPVNYALVKIIPPKGVSVDQTRRPYVIIDPRAGHGPGIGGFKDDSQVGVAVREGHPVYFVIFFPDPQPGQTLLDVTEVEAAFIRRVRELHPKSPKPAIVGNCQGGWAAMMVAAGNPDETGPIVINGAPMSYWGGAWSEGDGDNPMRYAGGLLGGTWLASMASDLGNGKFDGAHLVQNMENLNPANTLWDKYYHVYANADTEGPRFLEFERWWGGYYFMNREEIDWITQNLFVGNRLWEMDGKAKGFFDLRNIKVPIVLFASMGDNITPPQQAFNWVADVYESTEEIKARGQTIVGLLHHDIGHLGIFVSGRVAKKEHTQIVSVLKSIEALPPGLYGMKIVERPQAGGKPEYTVEFVERRLEDVAAQLNRYGRVDEKAFYAAAETSEFNQRAYDLFLSPWLKMSSNEFLADIAHQLHPLRAQRWLFSSMNPWLSHVKPVAEAVREDRHSVPPEHPFRQAERIGSDLLGASLDFYRDMRDAMSESLFFGVYGSLLAMNPQKYEARKEAPDRADEARRSKTVTDALGAIETGGYPEALARAASLLAKRDRPLPLSRLQLRKELLSDYKDFLPELPPEIIRQHRGVQDIIVQYEREAAIDALPKLLPKGEERERFLTLLDRLLNDSRIQADGVTPEQAATLARIRRVLAATPAVTRPATGTRRSSIGAGATEEMEGARR